MAVRSTQMLARGLPVINPGMDRSGSAEQGDG